MNNDLYNRIRELEPLLRLHFSDLGDVLEVNVDVKNQAIMEPMYTWGVKPSDHIQIFHNHGLGFNIKVLFKPRRD